jgi:hypothetical protein
MVRPWVKDRRLLLALLAAAEAKVVVIVGWRVRQLAKDFFRLWIQPDPSCQVGDPATMISVAKGVMPWPALKSLRVHRFQIPI